MDVIPRQELASEADDASAVARPWSEGVLDDLAGEVASARDAKVLVEVHEDDCVVVLVDDRAAIRRRLGPRNHTDRLHLHPFTVGILGRWRKPDIPSSV